MKALYTGSFDPITNGHLDVIKRIALMYDEVVVGVAINESKRYMFDLGLRIHMIQMQVPSNVIVLPVPGLVSVFALDNGIDVIIRGVRNGADVESETTMSHYNKKMGIETLFLPASPQFQSVSSTSVKFLVSTYVDTSEYVSPIVKHNMEFKSGYSLIGVVGNTGSGKSTMCSKIISDLKSSRMIDAIHIDVDKLAHNLYDPTKPTYKKISTQLIKLFGDQVILPDGKINRKVIADAIFTNPVIKQEFDLLIKQPLRLLITKDITEKINQVNSNGKYNFGIVVLIDASSLVENGSIGLVNNNIIHVKVDKTISIDRIKNRDGLTDDQANTRYSAQSNPDDRDSTIIDTINRTGYGSLLTVDGNDPKISSFLLDSIMKMATPHND